MKALRRYRSWLLGAAAALGIYWLYGYLTTPYTVTAALEDRKVVARIVTEGDGGSGGGFASLTLSRASGVSGTVTVVVPAGTVLYAGAGTQRLMTAQPLTFILSDDAPSASRRVPVFCIDEFAETPRDRAALAFSAPVAEQKVKVEETERLHRLAACLAGRPESASDKQLAVWAADGRLRQKTREQQMEFLTDGFIRQLTKEHREEIEREKPKFISMAPMLSSKRLDQLIDEEMRESQPDIRAKAAKMAKAQLDASLGHALGLVASCDT